MLLGSTTKKTLLISGSPHATSFDLMRTHSMCVGAGRSQQCGGRAELEPKGPRTQIIGL